jgi:hypothetical protein
VGWKGAEQYPPILSAKIKVAEFIVVQQGRELVDPEDNSSHDFNDSAYENTPSSPRHPLLGCLQFVQEMMKWSMVRSSHRSMRRCIPDVRAEDSLQHHITRARGVNGARWAAVQGATLQHGVIPRQGIWADDGYPTIVHIEYVPDKQQGCRATTCRPVGEHTRQFD